MRENDVNLCARGQAEDFSTSFVTNKSFVRVLHGAGEECQKPKAKSQSYGERVVKVPAPKQPQEKMMFKYGKVSVQVKNAEQVRISEEDGALLLQIPKR